MFLTYLVRLQALGVSVQGAAHTIGRMRTWVSVRAVDGFCACSCVRSSVVCLCMGCVSMCACDYAWKRMFGCVLHVDLIPFSRMPKSLKHKAYALAYALYALAYPRQPKAYALVKAYAIAYALPSPTPDQPPFRKFGFSHSRSYPTVPPPT